MAKEPKTMPGGENQNKKHLDFLTAIMTCLKSNIARMRGDRIDRRCSMPKRRTHQEFAKLGEKDCWHSYSLQMLSPSKFNRVVGKILRGRYVLITSKLQDQASELYLN